MKTVRNIDRRDRTASATEAWKDRTVATERTVNVRELLRPRSGDCRQSSSHSAYAGWRPRGCR